ncbi:MAG: hypothetical protein L3J69_10305 [Desulfobacula sp.]|nr:hypothetical protein [Desulfobacula sp.]
MAFIKGNFIFYITLFSIFAFFACSEQQPEVQNDFIIKTSFISITGTDFSEELDLKRVAYPYNIKDNSTEYNKMVIHLVTMLTEEIILLSAAEDFGITITDAEFNAALDDFKKDYPEDSFEQILLKNAISYPLWLTRFKKNMIMDKLISRELRKKIEITSRDIVEFYNQFQQSNVLSSKDSDSVLNEIDNEKELVSRLRRHKTQAQYAHWIQKLGQDYPVEINKEELKTFLINIEIDKEAMNEK